MGELLLLYCQPVEAGADQPLDACRDWDVAHLVAPPPLEVEQPLLPQHPHGLLEEERVAAGIGDQRRSEPCFRERGVSREVGQHRRGLVWPEGLKVDGAPPALPAEEAGRVVLELGPCGSDEHERHLGLFAEDVRDQLE